MFTKITLTMTTIILLISLAGCGTTNQSNPKSTGSSDGTQNNPSGSITDTTDADNYQMLPVISGKVATLKLDANADGTSQTLKKGEAMSITLESNPSTGYSWYAAISDTAVLAQMGEPEYTAPAESSTPLVGASGTQTFLFQAAASGITTLTLEYKRGWETDIAPEKTITITVEVQ